MNWIDRLKMFLVSVTIAGAGVLAVCSPAAATRITATAATASLFAERCAMCHGEDGKGKQNWKAQGQPDFTDPGFQKSRSDDDLAGVISNGKGRFMPAFKSKLSADQIKQLVHEIRAFGKK